MLNHVENEQEHKTEESLKKKLLECYEVKNRNDSLRNHHHRQDEFEGFALFGGRNDLGSQTAETHVLNIEKCGTNRSQEYE